MANIAQTVSSALDYISDLRGESQTNTDASRIRAISRAGSDFTRRRLWSFLIQPNQELTGDGETQDFTITNVMPCREKGLDEVYVGGLDEGSRYQICDYNEYKNRVSQNAAERLVYMWYDADADEWMMHINPIPGNGVTITYAYFGQQDDVSELTDIVYCPDLTIIAQLALADIYHGEDELEKELQQKQEAEQLIEDLTGIDTMPSKNQLYAMTSIENSTRNRGVGNY